MTSPQSNLGMCTAECYEDSDCEAAAATHCASGFACAVPLVTGPFCCRRMCVCRDLVDVADDPAERVPAACDVSDPANTCCNLPGRGDDC